MILTKEQLLILEELGYDEECDSYYNTVTNSYQEFSSSATVKWPNITDVLHWFRKKGYKYSIVPATLSNVVHWEVYRTPDGSGIRKAYSWEEAEYEIVSKLINIEYETFS